MKMLVFALYTVGVFAVGFLFGAIVKLLIDQDNMKQLEIKNAALHRENAFLRKQDKVDTIEIIDNRAEPESYFAPF